MVAGNDDPARPWQTWLEESASAFDHNQSQTPSAETRIALYRSVLKQADYRCALSGQTFQLGNDLTRDDLLVVPIQPPELGGALHVGNFLPVAAEFAQAFARGHLSIGPRLDLLVNLNLIDAELLDKLNADGRLLVGTTAPDPDALRYHREQIFLA